ncbi:hypothetical protein Bbelb_424650 [Branchiostoma belcheri]|nr:hypothetical protein Bbelb_424650 [Branchiostoma belcheri]
MSFVRGTRPGYRPGAQAARPASQARKVPPADPLPSVCLWTRGGKEKCPGILRTQGGLSATQWFLHVTGVASLTGFRAGCYGLNGSQDLNGSCRSPGYQRG